MFVFSRCLGIVVNMTLARFLTVREFGSSKIETGETKAEEILLSLFVALTSFGCCEESTSPPWFEEISRETSFGWQRGYV